MDRPAYSIITIYGRITLDSTPFKAWIVQQIASGGFHLAAVVSLGEGALNHHEWSGKSLAVAGEKDGAAVAKMLNTVTSAETRRKLRDALARHGASVSQSLSNSVHGSPTSVETTSSISQEASRATGGGGRREPPMVSSEVLQDALEVARSAYARRKEREEREERGSSPLEGRDGSRRTHSSARDSRDSSIDPAGNSGRRGREGSLERGIESMAAVCGGAGGGTGGAAQEEVSSAQASSRSHPPGGAAGGGGGGDDCAGGLEKAQKAWRAGITSSTAIKNPLWGSGSSEGGTLESLKEANTAPNTLLLPYMDV
jgi:hypothetical protein